MAGPEAVRAVVRGDVRSAGVLDQIVARARELNLMGWVRVGSDPPVGPAPQGPGDDPLGRATTALRCGFTPKVMAGRWPNSCRSCRMGQGWGG